MKKKHPIIESIEKIRHQSTEIENTLFDEYIAGRISRRELLRHGSVLGMSLFLGGVGSAAISPKAKAAGGTMRVALQTPAAAIDPIKVTDAGGECMLQQTGEFLIHVNEELVLRPALAIKWKPNSDGTVWTLKLRDGVKFHNGKKMTAADVVATMDRLADPVNASNALSVFKGVLSKGGTRKVDDYTVEFHLEKPNGNFPYLVSSDNYNAIILPADYAGDFEKNFVGTGPFKLEKYTPKVGASFVRNQDYWGSKAQVERTEFRFYDDIQAQILAFQGREVDVITHLPVVSGRALLKDPNVNLIRVKSSAHTQVHMRCDEGPFAKDKRIRRALALSLNRTTIVRGLFNGLASLGNDSPFAPAFPSTDPSVRQRAQNIAEAKQLMAAAGVRDGFSVTLVTEKNQEVPDYAVLIQDAAKQIGINIKLQIEDGGTFYGDAVFGKSHWLDSTLGATQYASRGTPNTVLGAPLKSDGTWNSAHFKNKEYDRLVDKYAAALDISGQRAASGDIQRLLLDETPVIFGYFADWIVATAKNVSGVHPAAGHSQLYLNQASFK